MNDRVGVSLLTRLRVDFSDLKLHKFDHRFNCGSPLCSCGQGSESTVHFFLHCQLYIDLGGGGGGCFLTAYLKNFSMMAEFTQINICVVFFFMVAGASTVWQTEWF